MYVVAFLQKSKSACVACRSHEGRKMWQLKQYLICAAKLEITERVKLSNAANFYHESRMKLVFCHFPFPFEAPCQGWQCNKATRRSAQICNKYWWHRKNCARIKDDDTRLWVILLSKHNQGPICALGFPFDSQGSSLWMGWTPIQLAERTGI